MKTLEAGLIAYGWQGGTIHQILEEVKQENEIISTVYEWGRREAKQNPKPVAEYTIPVNSWNSDFNKDCTISYIKGLIETI